MSGGGRVGKRGTHVRLAAGANDQVKMCKTSAIETDGERGKLVAVVDGKRRQLAVSKWQQIAPRVPTTRIAQLQKKDKNM